MYRKSVWVISVIFLAFSFALAACGSTEEDGQEVSDAVDEGTSDEENDETSVTEEEEGHGEATDDAELLVYTSLYPLYDFASQIGGERAEVKNLIPAGAEPHDYEPKPSDVADLHEADLFVYNGGGFEIWIDDLLEAVDNEHWLVVDSTEQVDLLANEEAGHDHDHGHDDDHGHDEDGREEDHHDHAENGDHDHDHDENGNNDHGHGEDADHDGEGKEEDHDHDHQHGEYDPHVWLDPMKAARQAESIKDAFVEADPDHADEYESNYAELLAQLEELDQQFQDMVDQVERHDFVVSHEAFGYLAHRYGLNQVGITGLSPANEPSGSQLQQIVEFVEDNDIHYILFENQVTPNVVEVVKDETGADSLVLHNLEVITEEDLAAGKDYFSLMEHNLEVLQQALGSE